MIEFLNMNTYLNLIGALLKHAVLRFNPKLECLKLVTLYLILFDRLHSNHVFLCFEGKTQSFHCCIYILHVECQLIHFSSLGLSRGIKLPLQLDQPICRFRVLLSIILSCFSQLVQLDFESVKLPRIVLDLKMTSLHYVLQVLKESADISLET